MLKIKIYPYCSARFYCRFLIFFGEVFNKSKYLDLLCLPQYINHFKENEQFVKLCVDYELGASLAEKLPRQFATIEEIEKE